MLQGGHFAGKVVGQQVEPEASLLGTARCIVGARRVATPIGLTPFVDLGDVDSVALLVDDVGELAGDLVVHPTEVELLQAFPAGLTQPLEQLAQPERSRHRRRTAARRSSAAAGRR